MAEHRRVRLEGREYVWTGTGWYDARDYVAPTHAVVRELNVRLEQEVAKEDAAITDPAALIACARTARDAQQFHRAEKLARRALDLAPGSWPGLVVLCTILRVNGMPQLALEETEAYKDQPWPSLLVARATALCDLRRWDEAKREVARAMAIERSDEGLSIIRRIRIARPDLCRRGEVYPRKKAVRF